MNKIYLYTDASGVTAWRTLASLCEAKGLKHKSVYVTLNRSNPCQIRGKATIHRLEINGTDSRGKYSTLPKRG